MNKLLVICILLLTLVCFIGIGTAAPQKFHYIGIATYDELPATMDLEITGDYVSGILNKPGICDISDPFSGIALTTTTLYLKGNLLFGKWEGSTYEEAGIISGTWTGGDTLCGDQLSLADGYPTNGTFDITMSKDMSTVQLTRTGPSPYLPTYWTYDFGPKRISVGRDDSGNIDSCEQYTDILDQLFCQAENEKKKPGYYY